MKIDLNKILAEKIVEPLDLGEYHAQFAGQVMQVWVNPPLAVRKRYAEIRRKTEAIRQEIKEDLQANKKLAAEQSREREELSGQLLKEQNAWLAEIWSQGPDDTRMTAEEVELLRAQTQETNPRLFSWLISRTIRMMAEHLGFVKNA
jgi:predicted nuclease with TOPRIM domain